MSSTLPLISTLVLLNHRNVFCSENCLSAYFNPPDPILSLPDAISNLRDRIRPDAVASATGTCLRCSRVLPGRPVDSRRSLRSPDVLPTENGWGFAFRAREGEPETSYPILVKAIEDWFSETPPGVEVPNSADRVDRIVSLRELEARGALRGAIDRNYRAVLCSEGCLSKLVENPERIRAFRTTIDGIYFGDAVPVRCTQCERALSEADEGWGGAREFPIGKLLAAGSYSPRSEAAEHFELADAIETYESAMRNESPEEKEQIARFDDLARDLEEIAGAFPGANEVVTVTAGYPAPVSPLGAVRMNTGVDGVARAKADLRESTAYLWHSEKCLDEELGIGTETRRNRLAERIRKADRVETFRDASSRECLGCGRLINSENSEEGWGAKGRGPGEVPQLRGSGPFGVIAGADAVAIRNAVSPWRSELRRIAEDLRRNLYEARTLIVEPREGEGDEAEPIVPDDSVEPDPGTLSASIEELEALWEKAPPVRSLRNGAVAVDTSYGNGRDLYRYAGLDAKVREVLSLSPDEQRVFFRLVDRATELERATALRSDPTLNPVSGVRPTLAERREIGFRQRFGACFCSAECSNVWRELPLAPDGTRPVRDPSPLTPTGWCAECLVTLSGAMSEEGWGALAESSPSA